MRTHGQTGHDTIMFSYYVSNATIAYGCTCVIYYHQTIKYVHDIWPISKKGNKGMPKHTSAGEDMIQSGDRCNYKFTSGHSFGGKTLFLCPTFITYTSYNQCNAYLDTAPQHTYSYCPYMTVADKSSSYLHLYIKVCFQGDKHMTLVFQEPCY